MCDELRRTALGTDARVLEFGHVFWYIVVRRARVGQGFHITGQSSNSVTGGVLGFFYAYACQHHATVHQAQITVTTERCGGV